jgi:TonB family protein
MLSSQTRYPRAAAPSSFKPAALAAVLIAALAGTSQAQTVPPAKGAGPGQSASERASKEGDKVFQWIRIQADKPRKATAAPAASTEKPPVAAAVAPAPAKVAARAAVAKPAANDATPSAAEPAADPAAKAAPREERMAAAKPVTQPDPALPAVETKDASAPNAAASPVVEMEEEVALTPVTKSDPEFPPSLMRQLRKGLVQVGFTVQPDGTVTDAHAVTSTHPRLAPSAVHAVQQWKFQPIRHAEQAVVELGFNLE